jgi:hypothetical protein
MRHFFEVLVYIFSGIALLWFGYTLFFSVRIPAWGGGIRDRRRRKSGTESVPGESQTCPVCSAKLFEGELVRSLAFPSLNGGKDRFLHIKGCVYCLRGGRQRTCPVCGINLKDNEALICRFFERYGWRSHVHVLGCSRCRGQRFLLRRQASIDNEN